MTEANVGSEVRMSLDSLRMLTDQLYTVLMTLVEEESFHIFVASGQEKGWKTGGVCPKNETPLTMVRAR